MSSVQVSRRNEREPGVLSSIRADTIFRSVDTMAEDRL